MHFVELIVATACIALPVIAQQQPSQAQQQFGTRLSQVVPRSETPREKNYQLELSITKGGKTARYRVALNGGQVSTSFSINLRPQPIPG